MLRRPRYRNGFTLVELIVLIVTVPIASIFVMTYFPRNREVCGKRSNCSSNLRQIGLAIEQYDMDYKQGYPRATGPGNVGIGARSLALLARPYPKADKLSGQLTNLKVFVCPSSGDKPDQFTETWTEFSSAKSISYGYDPGHASNDGTDVIVAADYSLDGKNSRNHGRGKDHNGAGQNVLFLGDWHVEWTTTPNYGVQENNIYRDDAPDLPRAQDSIIVR